MHTTPRSARRPPPLSCASSNRKSRKPDRMPNAVEASKVPEAKLSSIPWTRPTGISGESISRAYCSRICLLSSEPRSRKSERIARRSVRSCACRKAASSAGSPKASSSCCRALSPCFAELLKLRMTEASVASSRGAGAMAAGRVRERSLLAPLFFRESCSPPAAKCG